MRPAAVVVPDPLAEDPSQMQFTQRNDVIDAFAPHGTDEPLAVRIGLRRPWRRLQDLETKISQALVE